MRAIIVLYILLGIIALIVILLHFSIRANIKLNADGFQLKVKYLFFTVFQLPEDPDKKKKKKQKKPKKKKLKKNEKTKHIEVSDTPLSEEEIDELKKQLDEDDTSDEDIVVEEKKPEPPPKPLTKAEQKALKKKQKEEKKKAKEEKKRLKAEEKANKPPLKEKIADLKRKWLMIKPYIPVGWKAVKKLLKTIRFRKTSIQLGFGKEDPHEAAMNYGKMNIAVYDGLALLGHVFTMHYKRVKIYCLFNENTTKYDIDTTIYVRPSTVIAIAFCTLVNFLKIFISQKLKARKERKAMEKAMKKAEKLKSKNTETECIENERKQAS